MPRPHMHADVEANLVERGDIRYFFGGRFHVARAGTLAIFWGGIPHQALGRSAGLEGVWMTLPLGWLLGWRHAGQLRERLMAGEFLARRFEAADRASLLRWRGDCDSGSVDRRGIAAREVEAWLSRLSLSLPQKKSRAGSAGLSGSPARMEEVTRYLGSHYADDGLSVAQVAQATGFHPKYLLSFFRKHASLTLWDYVVRLRLAHAQRLLVTGDRTVLDIALASGFGSVSAFYQAFARHFPGATPSRYRRAA